MIVHIAFIGCIFAGFWLSLKLPLLIAHQARMGWRKFQTVTSVFVWLALFLTMCWLTFTNPAYTDVERARQLVDEGNGLVIAATIALMLGVLVSYAVMPVIAFVRVFIFLRRCKEQS